MLTLSCRHIGQDLQLLSTFIHEQTHWFLEEHEPETRAAVVELRRKYPKLPVGFPEGANDESSSYEHLIVNYLEIASVAKVAGAEAAAKVLEVWKSDHYRALYRIVDRDRGVIEKIVRAHGLMPGGLGASGAY